MPTKVFANKDCRGDYTNHLRKITEARKYRNCFKLIREKKYALENTLLFRWRSICCVNCEDWHKVGTLSFQTSILKKCHERADKYADDVLWWLSSSIDLVASDAMYHGQCESFFFFTKKCISTTKGTKTEHTAGHTTNNKIISNFEKICK